MPRALRFFFLVWIVLLPRLCFGGGPKFIAGSTYYNSAVMGTPLHWTGGRLNYYVDQGDLSSTVNHSAAVAMVDAAAALWNGVATAAVVLTDKGTLSENVAGNELVVNALGQITAPDDVAPSATDHPLAILFDEDGSIIDALYGTLTSEPDNCSQNGVYAWIDNSNADATLSHAVILLNGRCTVTSEYASQANLLAMMKFNLIRAFGRVLGLDYAQIYPNALTDNTVGETFAWPIMQPLDGVCGSSGGDCIPFPSQLHYDDIAALNRLYPVTAANMGSFTGKQLTADNTIAIKGTIQFLSGYGMQGVNVYARPLDASGAPLLDYTVSAVSGALHRGTHGNPISGTTNKKSEPYTKWGSTDSALQGAFDLSGIPLPPNVTTANYQVVFESIAADDINDGAVGPYTLGQVTPSGTLKTLTLSNLSAGSGELLTVTGEGSATGGYGGSIGTEAEPRGIAPSGYWVGHFSQVGQTDWLSFPVRAGRTFSLIAQAADETGAASNTKAMPMIGIWEATDETGTSPVSFSAALNGNEAGECWLRATSTMDEAVRIAVADARGDGRPDYRYRGWLLYADTVSPTHLPAAGGAFVLHGMGFRSSDTVLVGGVAATLTSISPTEITAIAPAAATTGAVDVEVDDESGLNAAAIILDGISYDSGTGDALTGIVIPSGTVALATPLPFTVEALDANLKPVAGAVVTYTRGSSNVALGCGSASCTVTTSGDGYATLNITAVNAVATTVTASLSNGSSLAAHITGSATATSVVTALTPLQSVAAGATVDWPVQVLVIQNGAPASGVAVSWTGATDIAPAASTTTTNAAGIATTTMHLSSVVADAGSSFVATACVNSNCANLTAMIARPNLAVLKPVSGTAQTLAATATPSAMVFRLYDTDGNPMAAGTVALYEALYAWTDPCPAHTVCPAGALFSNSSSAALSDLNGLVSFTPITQTGTASRLTAIAVSGDTATVTAIVEQHP
jgi:hypothetical protein